MFLICSEYCLPNYHKEVSNNGLSISDELNVYTYNFQFRSYDDFGHLLPGGYLISSDCYIQCQEVHNNVIRVAKFIRDVIKHEPFVESESHIREISTYISSVNCIKDAGQIDWNNAGWHISKKQVVFGQHSVKNKPLSLASALDIVAHEFFHRVTIQTANLQYTLESGALNESYSDIFAILVVNYGNPDISNWTWVIGVDFGEAEDQPVRDLSDPGRCGHPASIQGYLREANLHTNCGIHNKAAYILLTSKDNEQEYLFTADSGAKLFYKALNYLFETSDFIDSRRALEKSAKTLFRHDPKKQEILDAIARAFDDVGISYPS